MSVSKKLRVLFVGGNERQRKLTASLAVPEGVDVEYVHPCWTSSWNKPLNEARRHLANVDALVVTIDLPTLMRKQLMRDARLLHVPIISVHARGRGAIRDAIETVIRDLCRPEAI